LLSLFILWSIVFYIISPSLWGTTDSFPAFAIHKHPKNNTAMLQCLQLSDNTSATVEDIVNCVQRINYNNIMTFQLPKIRQDTLDEAQPYIPIIIIVHHRPNNYRLLLHSLSSVWRIEETFLIISHDGYFEDMEDVELEAINFTSYFSIYHPYSSGFVKDRLLHGTELHKHTSVRHHFWWLWNTIWRGIYPSIFPNETKQFFAKQQVVFLEEDHYVSIDFYQALHYLVKAQNIECPEQCFGLSVGGHKYFPKVQSAPGNLFSLAYHDIPQNMGWSIGLKEWKKLYNISHSYCAFNDYNWDVTLKHFVFAKKLPTTIAGLVWSKAHHTGYCNGIHWKADELTCQRIARDTKRIVDMHNTWIQPDSWEKQPLPVKERTLSIQDQGHDGYGGWTSGKIPESSLEWNSTYHMDLCNFVATEAMEIDANTD